FRSLPSILPSQAVAGRGSHVCAVTSSGAARPAAEPAAQTSSPAGSAIQLEAAPRGAGEGGGHEGEHGREGELQRVDGLSTGEGPQCRGGEREPTAAAGQHADLGEDEEQDRGADPGEQGPGQSGDPGHRRGGCTGERGQQAQSGEAAPYLGVRVAVTEEQTEDEDA